ncbi:CsgG/HfaB family protein [Thauera mechernichensis]
MTLAALRVGGARLLTALGLLAAVQGCGTVGAPTVAPERDEPLFSGPPITDIVTPYDNALSCLRGRINTEVLRFSVGSILDATGKEQLADGGTAKFVTQGAGDIVQSALFQAGVVLVNRRDPRIMEAEAKWGIRDTKSQIASTFYITGSINSLDFLPGSGFESQIAGLGPRYRQHRILIGLDLSLTETRTGRVLANVPLQKQLVATEAGFGIGRFFGNTLVSVDLGNNQREAVHFALRQMLNLATFELLTQMMKPEEFKDCYALVEAVQGVSTNTPSSQRVNAYRANLARAAAAAAVAAGAPAVAASPPEAESPAGDGPTVQPNGDDGRSGTGATAPTTPAADNGGLAPAAEADSSYFADEQSSPSAAALQVLELRRSGANAANGASSGDPGAANLAPRSIDPACRPARDSEAPRITPLFARAPANKLRVTSPRAGTLCVSDGSGRDRAVALRAGEAVELDGLAPWHLYMPGMRALEINYQGNALPIPSFVKDRMELLERR